MLRMKDVFVAEKNGTEILNFFSVRNLKCNPLINNFNFDYTNHISNYIFDYTNHDGRSPFTSTTIFCDFKILLHFFTHL
jgi:hypothetical protein